MQSNSGELDRVIRDDVQAVLRGLGCDAVEVKSAIRRGTLHVVLIIHRKSGVDTDVCADVYRTIYPRLEMLYPGKDVHLEVSSPGIGRTLKSVEEFGIFKGLGVKLLLDEETDWKKGTIVDSTEESVDIRFDSTIETIQYAVIRKAKLDNL